MSCEPGTISNASGPGCNQNDIYIKRDIVANEADQINDLTEVDLDATFLQIGVTCRIVNELRKLALPHF
jgi:hypothetical protein